MLAWIVLYNREDLLLVYKHNCVQVMLEAVTHNNCLTKLFGVSVMYWNG